MGEWFIAKNTAVRFIIMIVFLSIVGLLLSCALLMVWSKPYSTRQEFAKDKYDCAQEAQQRSSFATGGYCVGSYCQPGQAQSRVHTNMNLFNACMD